MVIGPFDIFDFVAADEARNREELHGYDDHLGVKDARMSDAMRQPQSPLHAALSLMPQKLSPYLLLLLQAKK